MRKTYNIAILSVLVTSAFVTASGQQGSMHGGQPPVVGAHIYVLSPAPNATPGTASVSLLTSGDGSDSIGFYVLTDSSGNFNVQGKYSCPTPDTPIYLYGAGGQAQTGYTNAAIAQAAYVAPCGTINSQTFVFMDEVTTVAMAYAVAGYATDPLHISYSGSQASLTGIENAFANVNNLVNTAQGSAIPTIPSGNAQAPQETVNTLADALASCINQTSGGDNCSTLFSAAPVNLNGLAPTDTATAVMNIAHNPASSTSPNIQNGTNITSIMTLASRYVQFTPNLPSTPAPNDLTLSLAFSNGGIANAVAVAIDGSGNAWIASQPSSNGSSSVVEIASPTNMQLNDVTYPVDYPPSTGEPFSIAVDAQSQNIWIGTGSAVEEFSTTGGAPASGSPFLTNDNNFGGGYGLNLDSAGNVWIAAYSTIYKLSATGSTLSQCGGVSGGYCLPAGQNGTAVPSSIALDASNNVWVTDWQNNALIELNSQGTVLANLGPSTTSDFNTPYGVAINGSQDAWVANGNNYATEYIPNGQTQFVYVAADTPPPYTTTPSLLFVGIDGAGNSWYSLQSAHCSSSTTCLGVAEVSGAGRPLSGPGYTIDGYQPTGSPTASATAIDGSGDVWIANTSAENVTELIGAAVPVVTPLALAVSSNSLGSRP